MSFDTSYTGTPLFLGREKYRDSVKVAAITLSRDGADWEEQISQALHSEHPHIQEHNIQIGLSKSDPEHGAGIGTIKIDDRVVVPIVIEDFKLAPLDLFWHNNEIHPMTRPSLERVLQETSIGKPVAPGQGEESDSSLYSRTQPPFDGKYTYAEFVDRVDFLAAINKAFTQDGLKYELSKNAEFAQAVKRVLASDTGQLRKEASAAPKGRLTVRTVKSFSKVAKAGGYEIGTGGHVVPALVFDVVFGPSGILRSDTGMAVSLEKNAQYSFLTKGQDVGGRQLGEGSAPVSSPSGTGVFFTMNKVAACTEPITIDFEVGEDGEYAARDAMGQRFRVCKTAGITAPLYANGSLHIPDGWHWMKLAGRMNPMTTQAANIAFAPSESHIAILQSGGRFTVRGLDGFPADGDGYEKTAEALSGYFDEEDVNLVMKTAANEPVLYLNVSMPKIATKKVVAKRINPVNLCKEAAYVQPMGDLEFPVGNGYVLKVAAVTDDASKRTVDSLLSLNFLNPETLHKFADKLPQLEEAKTTVAKLLLASRLGLDIDSRPLRTSMYALDSVVRDLRELQNAAEVEEQES